MGSAAIAIGTFAYSMKAQNKLIILPAVPILMLVGYHAQQCTPTHNTNVHIAADALLQTPAGAEQVRLVGGPITLAELDRRRARNERNVHASV